MRFKRIIASLYGAAFVFGISMLVSPHFSGSGKKPHPAPSPVPGSVSALPPTPTLSIKGFENQYVGNFFNPTPTPLPPVVFQDILYDLSEPASVEFITDYLNAYYSGDTKKLTDFVTDETLIPLDDICAASEGVTEISDIKLYSKPGIGSDSIDLIVYATFSLHYKTAGSSLPCMEEIYLRRLSDGSFRVITDTLSGKAVSDLARARKTQKVMNLAVTNLISRYQIACLNADEELAKSCISNQVYLDMDLLNSRYAYTVGFSDITVNLFEANEENTEIDYVAFSEYKEKIVLIDTPAPCLESYFIKVDPISGKPYIFVGETSVDTDAFYASLVALDEVQALAEKTNAAMEEALLKDRDLKAFYERLNQ